MIKGDTRRLDFGSHGVSSGLQVSFRREEIWGLELGGREWDWFI